MGHYLNLMENKAKEQEFMTLKESPKQSPRGGGGLGAKTGLYKVHNLQPRSGNPKQGGTGPLSREDGNTYCLDTGNTQGIETESRIRRLTPIECERLQGFPDRWTEGLSDSQRYKCLGNAVTVNVIKSIVIEIEASIK